MFGFLAKLAEQDALWKRLEHNNQQFDELNELMREMFDDKDELNKLMARKEFLSNWENRTALTLAIVLARIAEEQIDKELEGLILGERAEPRE